MAFENFITHLCSAKNLIDVSENCLATQSSLSQWSVKEDAKQLLRNNDREFANHTAYETNPWVEIDLVVSTRPEFVIVQNRERQPFDEIASTIKIECSDNREDYTTLHQGSLFFGALPDNLPLILPLKRKISFRFLRLSLDSDIEVPLHLKRVNILVQRPIESLKKNETLTFYADRKDGLGERLKAILNAMVLADFYCGSFKFSWQVEANLASSHVIGEPDTIFSNTFLRNHLVNDKPSETYDLNSKATTEEPYFEPGSVVKVTQNNFLTLLPALKKKISTSSFRKCFFKVGFSKEVNNAIEFANKVDLNSETASIHLRAGDIIYGRYRYDDRYTNKVISFAQADYIMSELKKLGVQTVLFGENIDICRLLADKHDGVFMGDFGEVENFSRVQLAFFDIVLMSRTNQIFAGKSGFSQLAELVGNTKITSPNKSFSQLALSEYLFYSITTQELDVDRYQRAFSCWHCVFNYKEYLGTSRAIDLMKIAIELDSCNVFYEFILSVLYFESGDNGKSEEVVERILQFKGVANKDDNTYRYLQTHKHPDKTKPLERYKSRVLDMVKANIKGAEVLFKDFC